MTDEDGGQAFPRAGDEMNHPVDGMSNRDWLEGMAISGVMNNLLIAHPDGYKTDKVAELVEAIADAILKRRALRVKP